MPGPEVTAEVDVLFKLIMGGGFTGLIATSVFNFRSNRIRLDNVIRRLEELRDAVREQNGHVRELQQGHQRIETRCEERKQICLGTQE